VVAPATHDTASAVVGAPIGEGWAYLSSGTWSLLGIETEAPLLTNAAREVGLTNEGGLEGKNRLLKNIAGMWILESCRKIWATQGEAINFDDINRAIAAAQARQAFVLPDDPRFFNPPDMPKALAAFLRESGQPVPADYGGYARVVLESLALRYAAVVEAIERVTGRAIVGIRIIGGGSQNRFLNQATADATGREVRAGPIEATALGNVIVQAISDGCFGNVSEARSAVARHMEDDVYEPTELEAWVEARAQYARLEREWGR
jgi:rhamnulokinase